MDETKSIRHENADVTLIREMLALTPAERFALLVQSARNLMKLREKKRVL